MAQAVDPLFSDLFGVADAAAPGRAGLLHATFRPARLEERGELPLSAYHESQAGTLEASGQHRPPALAVSGQPLLKLVAAAGVVLLVAQRLLEVQNVDEWHGGV